MTSVLDTQDANWTDSRVIARLRAILAFSALLIMWLDPPKPDRHAAAIYTALILYSVYSATVYLLMKARKKLVANISHWGHWPDVAWYTLLIALNNGVSSLFFYGFFFAILVSSIRMGFWRSLIVAAVSAVSYIIISLLTHPSDSEFEINRLLLRTLSFLIIGYLIAYIGESELMSRRLLRLLREVNQISNPRFGIDRTIGSVIEQLRAFYNADTCLLILEGPETSTFTMRNAVPQAPETAMRSEPISARLAQQLLELPPNLAAIRHGDSPWWRFRQPYATYACDKEQLIATDVEHKTIDALATLLDAESFVTIPFNLNQGGGGRLFITGKNSFTTLDVELLLQVTEQILPTIDNIRLVDRLALEAAEDERQRIARNIHDSVIQPYIGLQIGLAAVRQQLPAGEHTLATEIEQLNALTEKGINDLRQYIHTLRQGTQKGQGLLAAIRRFSRRFSNATGITVEVIAKNEIEVNDRLSAEVFQMVTEGLSNIRRHTRAVQAVIRLASDSDQFILRIENEGDEESDLSPFTPRSITERALALGGKARVERGTGGDTAVCIEIPM